jgi:hypothetical protein
MSSRGLQILSESELVEKFAALAKEAGSAVLDSDAARANRALRRIWAIEDELRARGRDARLQLGSLLDDSNRLVRYYAAQALLGLVPDRARPIIAENAKYSFDAICGDARGFLSAYDTGQYKPD